MSLGLLSEADRQGGEQQKREDEKVGVLKLRVRYAANQSQAGLGGSYENEFDFMSSIIQTLYFQTGQCNDKERY